MIEGYSSFMVEMVREKLGYEADDESHDAEVLAYLTGGEKISKSKHVPSVTKIKRSNGHETK